MTVRARHRGRGEFQVWPRGQGTGARVLSLKVAICRGMGGELSPLLVKGKVACGSRVGEAE